MAKSSRSSLEESPRPVLSKNAYRQARRLLSFLAPYRWSFFGGLVFLFLGSAVFMILPVAAGELLNIATGTSAYGLNLRDLGWILLVVLLVQGFSSYLRVWLFTQVSEKGMADLRKALYVRLLHQPQTFFEQNRVGELVSRSTADIGQLQDVLSITLAEFIRQVILLLGGLVVLVWKGWELALLMLSIFPVVIIVALVFGRYIRRLSKERQAELAHTTTILDETLQGITVVKTFTGEWLERKRYQEAMDKVVDLSLRFALVRGLFIVFIITVLFGAMFFVLWWGAGMVQEGRMRSGDLVTFITLTAVVGGALASLGDFYTQMLKAVGASERLMELLDQDLEMQPLTAPPPALTQSLEGQLSIKDLHFAYPSRPDLPVFQGLELEVKAGQTLALVGASGGGKSTLLSLLLRLHKHQQGQILLDGQGIETYDLTFLRQNMALVPQDVMLFAGSIRDNIAYGRPSASEAELIEAAKQANAWSFISQFSDGLDTWVGERGVKLSGGQRQRIAIARAILKNPPILLLDEATSALDAESEKVVQEALERLMKGRTSLIVAHRLSTIKQADVICVLDQGQIVERGSHQELLQKEGGLYRQLASLQDLDVV